MIQSIALLAMFLVNPAHAGQEIGNGGDLIVCKQSSTNEFNGYYSLDFVLTYPAPEVVPVTTWQASLTRIAGLIKAKVPELYMSFKTFQDDVFNTSFERRHVWEQAPFGLIPVDDQQIATLLPPNCLEGGKINLIQAVIRLNPDYSGAETQIFKYMPTAIDTLNVDRQIQTSFLLVHEWLWELSKNVDRNRRIDRYLHSKTFAAHTGLQAITQLRGMGLNLTGDSYAYDSLQSAISSALPGATVWLLNKTYQDDVKITRPVTLKPLDDSTQAVVTGKMEINADNVTIQDMDFELKGDGVWSSGKNLKIIGSRFHSNAGSTAVFLRDPGSASISNSTFDSVTYGIEAWGATQVAITGNQFINTYAINLKDANGRITNNAFSKSWFDVEGTSKAEVSNNTLVACGSFCMRFDGQSEVSVTNNSVSGAKYGLSVADHAKVVVQKNQFLKNDIGLSLTSEEKSSQVFGNLFKQNRLGIDNVTKVTLGANSFEGNTQDVSE